MQRALEVAATTPAGDVPVGAVVFGPGGEELASATNRRELTGDPLAHAEVCALVQAAATLGDGWRLENCTLVVTLEPCVMCAGAALNSRIGHIIFGAYEPKSGACGSVLDVVRSGRLPHTPQVTGGVMHTECAALLTEFFYDIR